MAAEAEASATICHQNVALRVHTRRASNSFPPRIPAIYEYASKTKRNTKTRRLECSRDTASMRCFAHKNLDTTVRGTPLRQRLHIPSSLKPCPHPHRLFLILHHLPSQQRTWRDRLPERSREGPGQSAAGGRSSRDARGQGASLLLALTGHLGRHGRHAPRRRDKHAVYAGAAYCE